MEEFKVGDKVLVPDSKWVGVWTVVKVNQVTYQLEQNGARLKAHKTLVAPVDAKPASAAVTVESLGYQNPGSFVRFVGRGGDKLAKDTVLVVLADKGARVNATLPGGNGGSYWRLPRRSVEAVEVKVAVVS